MDKTEILQYLMEHPDMADVLKLAVEHEEENTDKEYYLGWKWSDVKAYTPKINKLIVDGLVNIRHDSHSKTTYLLENQKAVKQAVKEFKILREKGAAEEESQVPQDLFNIIVGYQEEKMLFKDALQAKKPCHILLIGPPASAKSLFLLELDRLPDSYFCLGGQTSKVGLADEMVAHAPKYLIIDELDDMPLREQTVLKSLMQTGIIARRKHRIRQRQTFKTWVFGSCNSIRKLSEAIKSRFLKIHCQPYTQPEFKEVVVSVLTKREGVDKPFAGYIAEQVGKYTRDPREAIALSRVADSEEKLNSYVDLLWKKNKEGVKAI